MTIGSEGSIAAAAALVFAYSLVVFVIGLLLRLAGIWLRSLRAPANRLLILFGVFTAASLFVLMTRDTLSCENASLERWMPSTCLYPWIRQPLPLEVDLEHMLRSSTGYRV